MGYETVTYETRNSVGLLTLNRPKQLNAISPQLATEAQEALERADHDEAVRVTVVTGGTRCFSAGADLKAIESEAGGHRGAEIISSFLHGLELFEKPLIAAVSGYALGGGCELAMGCDLRIASASAKFGLPEIKVGLIPAGGGTQRLTQIIGSAKAKELMFTGDFIDAGQALSIGLISKVVPVEALADEAMKIALVLAKRPPLALKAIKRCVNLSMQLELWFKYERECTDSILQSEDAKEGMRAFIEKREPLFKGK